MGHRWRSGPHLSGVRCAPIWGKQPRLLGVVLSSRERDGGPWATIARKRGPIPPTRSGRDQQRERLQALGMLSLGPADNARP